MPGCKGSQTRASEQFCQTLPDLGETVFVLDYLHGAMKEVPIDFRIIRNVTGQGRFTNLDHVESIRDLEAVTVYHHAAAVQPDVFTITHEFEEPGEFVGIVTVQRPDGRGVYSAVFPFEAGYTGLGYWPWVIGGLILLQLNYLWMSGRLRRSRDGDMAPVDRLPESRSA